MSGAEGGVGPDLAPNGQPKCYVDYDPTNGTSSLGDVYRFGGGGQSGRFMLNGGLVGEATSPGGGAW